MIAARRIIFYLFLSAYLILCPLLILYALGYIINPLKHEIEHTGIIYLSTTPIGANIFLEKSRYKYKTPAAISELLPGDYNIKITLKGYKPWTHIVSVLAGKAAAFENILLLPVILEREEIAVQNFEKLIPVDGADYFLLAAGHNLGGFLKYDVRNKIMEPVISEKSPYYNFPVSSVFTEDKSKIVIIYGGSLWDKKMLYVDLNTENPVILDITEFITNRPDNIIWDYNFAGDLFVLQKGNINRVDVKSGAVYPNFIENIKGAGIADKKIFILDNNGDLLRYTYDKEDMDVLFAGSKLGEKRVGGYDFYRIEILDDKTFVFINNIGELTSNLSPYQLIETGARGVVFYRPKNYMFYWTKDTIYIANFFKKLTKQSLFQESIQIKELYSYGRDIKQCFWAYNGSHMVFLDNDTVFLLEIEPQGEHHVEEITKIKRGTSFYYSEKNGCVYYIDAKTAGLNSVKVIPVDSLVFAPLILNRVINYDFIISSFGQILPFFNGSTTSFDKLRTPFGRSPLTLSEVEVSITISQRSA